MLISAGLLDWLATLPVASEAYVACGRSASARWELIVQGRLRDGHEVPYRDYIMARWRVRQRMLHRLYTFCIL